MTRTDIDALAALLAAATPGEWEAVGDNSYGYLIGPPVSGDGEMLRVDAAFIAAAHTALPALLAEVRALREVALVAETLAAGIAVEGGHGDRAEAYGLALRAALARVPS